MIKVNSKVFAVLSGGWNNDGNTVIEIDPSSFTVVNTFDVSSVPVDIVADNNNNIWVYYKGIPDYTKLSGCDIFECRYKKRNPI